MGLTLKQRTLNVCEDQRGIAEELAKIAGYSTGTALMKILRDEKKEFAKFYGLVKIVRHLFPEDEKQLMSEYALTLDPNKQTARYMLEYLNINKMEEAHLSLLQLMKECGNKESQEWAEVYELAHISIFKSYDSHDLVNRLYALKLKKIETEIMKDILLVYEYYANGSFELMSNIAHTVLNKADEVKDEFIKRAFCSRICVILTVSELHKGKIEESRIFAKKGLLFCDVSSLRSLLYLYLGNSYSFESYKKSRNYLVRGLELADKENYQYQEIIKSLNFAANFWGEEPQHLNLSSNKIEDKHEIIHYYAKKGNKSEAKKVLASIEYSNDISDYQKAFTEYFKYSIEGNEEYLYNAIRHFKASGDRFYLNLPLIALKKHGVNDFVLKALAV